MTTTIQGLTLHTPDGINGYNAAVEVGTIIHRLVGGSIATTLRDSPPRTGTLECHFSTESAAQALADDLATPGTFTFTTDEMAAGDMEFVVTDGIDLEQDDTRNGWIVTFTYQQTVIDL